MESPDGSKIVFCNMVFWGTLYQLCIPVLDKTAGTVVKCIAERWIQYFGPPVLILADQGKSLWALSSKKSRMQTARRESTMAKWADSTTR